MIWSRLSFEFVRTVLKPPAESPIPFTNAVLISSADDFGDCVSQWSDVVFDKGAKAAQHEPLLKGCEHRFDHGGLEQPRRLPMADPGLTHAGIRPELAGYRHDDQIRPGGAVGAIADDDPQAASSMPFGW